MPLVGLSLGSNLGDRLANLRSAVDLLSSVRASDHLLCSEIYETDPVDCASGTPSFFNAAVEIETETEPVPLLSRLKEIELRLGRSEIRELNASRPIDLDILYYGDRSVAIDGLIIPHPRMRQRGFVLLPLHDIRPDLVPEDLDAFGETVRPTGHRLAVSQESGRDCR